MGQRLGGPALPLKRPAEREMREVIDRVELDDGGELGLGAAQLGLIVFPAG